jgi:BirA family biotin operon repressor/biotin-[acetyl-CoA-carboxylase] ligase
MIVSDPNVDSEGLQACQSLANAYPFAMIRYFAEVDSTNTAAMVDLGLADELATPRLYVADSQVAGRGRHGKSWVADHGTLTFSLVVPSVMLSSGLPPPISIAVGVAIARTIEHLAAPLVARIKWPNDVYIDDGKVAGILIEAIPTRHDAVVIGVGLNVATDFRRTDAVLDSPAKSICELTQRYPRRYQWLEECVGQILDALDELANRPLAILNDHRSRCLLKGNSVRYLDHGLWQHGHCEGIDNAGSLLVRFNQTLHRLSSGEVHRVRRAETNH